LCLHPRAPARDADVAALEPSTGMAATSGMNVYAASFLIPLGVLFYTLIGK
jgi:hypothetical protein